LEDALRIAEKIDLRTMLADGLTHVAFDLPQIKRKRFAQQKSAACRVNPISRDTL